MTLTQIPITKYMQKTESKPMVRHIRKFTDIDRELLTQRINIIVENGGSFYLQFRVGEHMAIPPPFFVSSGHKPLSTFHNGKLISLSKLIRSETGWPSARFLSHLVYVTASGHRVFLDV
jgi:hypothetical protein